MISRCRQAGLRARNLPTRPPRWLRRRRRLNTLCVRICARVARKRPSFLQVQRHAACRAYRQCFTTSTMAIRFRHSRRSGHNTTLTIRIHAFKESFITSQNHWADPTIGQVPCGYFFSTSHITEAVFSVEARFYVGSVGNSTAEFPTLFQWRLMCVAAHCSPALSRSR